MFRNKSFIICAAVLILWISPAGICDQAEGIVLRDSSQTKESKQRVEKLEGELAELKRLMAAQQDRIKALEEERKATPASASPDASRGGGPSTLAPAQAAPRVTSEPNALSSLTTTEVGKLRKMLELEQKKKAVWSGLDIQLYGMLKVDASYDSDRTNPGNYVLYVDSLPNNKNDDEFNLTANQTRLGMKIAGPDDSVVKTSGLVEVDFYGNYAEENKAKLQMRHAWMKMDWPEDKFSILAGQTTDTISPLAPDTLNYTVLWDSGNIGYRRPQVRLTKGFAVAKDTELQLEGAAARTIGRSSTMGSVTSESGEDAGYPTAQGRVSLTFPGLGYKPTTVGFSGHYGREEYDTALTGANKKFESWSANLDVTQPINKWLTVKGELFNGLNLNTYLGGVGQGVNTTNNKEISAKGGWIAASLGPWDSWRFNTGVGIDEADRDDLSNGSRTLNRSIFGNVLYSVNKNAEVGVEVSHWRTAYKNSDDMDDLRVQTSFIQKF